MAFGYAATPAAAACATRGQKLTAEDMQNYADRPTVLVNSYPKGGDAMVRFVSTFVAQHRDGLRSVLKVANLANAAQREAIGAGLGQALGLCTISDSGKAREIREAAARMSDSTMLKAYYNASPDDGGAAPVASPVQRPGISANLPISGSLTNRGAAEPLSDPFGPPP